MLTIQEMQFVTSSRIDFAHPRAQGQFQAMQDELDTIWRNDRSNTRFVVFEVYRNPFRQRYLKAYAKTSKADAFESAHQYGLAADFVPKIEIAPGKWSYNWDDDHDYDLLKKVARKHGCDVPISWDKCHVEHPMWTELRQALSSQ
jgi:hypothetical protein